VHLPAFACVLPTELLAACTHVPCPPYVPAHRSQLTSAQKYFVTIHPGVDICFIVALATLIDEIFQDQPRDH
jgi:hypothetical protein